MWIFDQLDFGSLLNGSVLIALFLAVVATWPICVLLLHAYRRTIARGMLRGRAAAAPGPESLPVPTRYGPRIEIVPAEVTGPRGLVGRAERRARRARLLVAGSGLAYGFGTTVSMHVVEDLAWLPVRATLLTLVFAWPAVPTWLALSPGRRRSRVLVWAVYLAALMVAMVVGGLSSVREILTLAAFMVAVPALFVLATGARLLRGAAWFVVPGLMLVVTPLILIGMVLIPFLVEAGAPTRLWWTVVLVCLAIALTAVTVLLLYAWCFSRVYQRKWASELTLLVLQWWFFAALWMTLFLSTQGSFAALLGLTPYLLLLLILLVAALLRRPYTEPPARLLLLRTFGSRGRSTRLLRDLTTQWRWVGSVELIIAPDLASETLEPDEFLDFIYRRLASRFVQDGGSLQRRLASLDRRPDRDGRYRVNELLCHDDTWRPAVESLATTADAVLIDLRGFSPRHAGVAYELERLVALVPLDRVVAAVDATTDQTAVQHALDRAVGLAPGAAPFRADPMPRLRTVSLAGGRQQASRGLLAALARAAAPVAPGSREQQKV